MRGKLDHSLVLKNQSLLSCYHKSSKATQHYSTAHYKLLSRPLSHDILMISLRNAILRSCMTVKLSTKPPFSHVLMSQCEEEWFSV